MVCSVGVFRTLGFKNFIVDIWFNLDLDELEALKIQWRIVVVLGGEHANAALQDWTTGHLLAICQSIYNLAGIFNIFSKLNVHVLVLQL